MFVTSGATCLPKRTIPDFQPSPLFQADPSVEQLAEVFNRSRNIQSLQSNSVTINVNKERTINANLTWAREKRFRMNATIAGGIAGVDIGSNDEGFWMAIRQGLAKSMYFARHAEFDAQPNRPILPVSPVWLIQALGVCDMPYLPTQPPIKRPDGMLEISTIEPSPIGDYTRTLVVDPKYGFSREIRLRDPTGIEVAKAFQSKHEYYASVQTSLPRSVKVQLFATGGNLLEIEISIAAYVVNGLAPEDQTQFTFPNTNGYQLENLAQLTSAGQPSVVPQQVAPPQNNYPQASYRGVAWESR